MNRVLLTLAGVGLAASLILFGFLRDAQDDTAKARARAVTAEAVTVAQAKHIASLGELAQANAAIAAHYADAATRAEGVTARTLERINNAPDTNACAASPAVRVALDGVRAQRAAGVATPAAPRARDTR